MRGSKIAAMVGGGTWEGAPMPGMRRWEFVSLFGSGAAWPMAAIAQQRLPVIGLLSRGRMRILWQRSAKFFLTTMAAAVVLGLAPMAQADINGCAFVRKNPYGILYLRAFPTPSAMVVGKIRSNDFIEITNATCQQQGTRNVCDETGTWTKVTSKWNKTPNQITWLEMDGWVASRFLEFTECHGGEVEKDKGRR